LEFATRLVVDAGIRVIKVEPQTGDPLRQRRGFLFDWLNAGKECIRLDRTSSGAGADFARLIETAAAIVADAWGMDVVRPYDVTVPLIEVGDPESECLLAGAAQDEFLAFHGSGLGYLTPRMMPGYPSGPPLAPRSHLVQFLVGLYGAISVFALLRSPTSIRARVGIAGAVLPLLRREIAAVKYQGIHPHRNERIWRVSPAEVHRCRDGWIFVDVIEDGQWAKLCAFIGRPELADDPAYKTRDLRFEASDAICRLLDDYFHDRPKSCWRDAQDQGVPVAPVNDLGDLLADRQLAFRDFWTTFKDGHGHERRGPRSPLAAHFSACIDTPLPAVDAGKRDTRQAPLAGVRVLELTHVWSGPLCGQILADLGAEVIKVENRQRIDIHRRGGPYPGDRAGINRSGTWNSQNRGKLGCTLDLKQQEGRAIFLDLVSRSDIVIENFTPGTLSRLGLGMNVLAGANPKIVVLSLSGFGQSGPDRNSLAYGPMMDAATGLSALTSYKDGIPRAVNGWAADVGGALHGCAMVLRSFLDGPKEAVHLDVSQFESGALFAAEGLLAAGNGLNPTAPADRLQIVAETSESDRWVAISASDGREVQDLSTLVGAGSGEPDAIRQGVLAWAHARTRHETVQALRQAGIPAVPVATVEDLLKSEELLRRGCWLDVDHAETGPMQSYGPAIRMEGVVANRLPAPCLGQHNDRIYGELLGIRPDAIASLRSRDVI
jgi:crotonobetainyl-CoA:carnitine CoA-transferase CaiB-like acyl-CoA transferase